MRGAIFFLAGTLLLAACAHQSEGTTPAGDSEPASMPMPDYAVTPKVARVEVIMYRDPPNPQVQAFVEVGSLVPSAPSVSSCVERAREGACVSYACEGFSGEDVYDKRYDAGPVHIVAAGLPLDLRPRAPSNEYPHDVAGLGDVPIADTSVVVTAEGKDVPPFHLETKFPPKVRIALPGREGEPNDFSRPWYAGSTPRNEDLVIPTDPPDVPVDVFIEGWKLGAPPECQIGERCTVMVHCQLPGQAPIPRAVLARFAIDATLEITVLSAQRTRTNVGGFDIELLAHGSGNRVHYLLH